MNLYYLFNELYYQRRRTLAAVIGRSVGLFEIKEGPQIDSAKQTIARLPVGISAGLSAGALALSLIAGALASFFMGRRTSRMKPADILRKL